MPGRKRLQALGLSHGRLCRSCALLLICLLATQHAVTCQADIASSARRLGTPNCSEQYAKRVRVKQAALITIYTRSIEEGAAREHMNPILNCLKNLAQIFRLRTFELDLPGMNQVLKEVEKIAQQAAERLCRETLERIRGEEREWLSVWEYAQSAARNHGTDWSLLARKSNQTSTTLSRTVTNRLKELIHHLY